MFASCGREAVVRLGVCCRLSARAVPEQFDESVVEDRFAAVVGAGGFIVPRERDQGCTWVTFKVHLCWRYVKNLVIGKQPRMG